jgi:hypothetical protein
MEITEHERMLLVNSLIQTISELYEHDRQNDRPALGALLTRMMAGAGEPSAARPGRSAAAGQGARSSPRTR